MNIRLLTKYLNRYLKKDERVHDWAYELDYNFGDGLIIFIDYGEEYHQAQKITINQLRAIPKKNFEEFTQSLYRNISHNHEEEMILSARDI